MKSMKHFKGGARNISFGNFYHKAFFAYTRAEVPKLWGALREGMRAHCTRNISTLNETWAQDKIYISVGTLLGLNILLTT
jgi:hypothetical protein